MIREERERQITLQTLQNETKKQIQENERLMSELRKYREALTQEQDERKRLRKETKTLSETLEIERMGHEKALSDCAQESVLRYNSIHKRLPIFLESNP